LKHAILKKIATKAFFRLYLVILYWNDMNSYFEWLRFSFMLRASLRVIIVLSAAWWTPAALADAQADINTSLTNFRSLVNSHTAAGDLDYTQLTPFFDANFLENGDTATSIAAEFADGLRGGSISSAAVSSVVTLSTDSVGTSTASTNGSLTAITNYGQQSLTWTPQFSDMPLVWYSKASSGTWKLYGNQLPANVQVQTFTENRQSGCGSGCDGVFYFLWFNARAPQNNFTTISVDGPGVTAAPLVLSGTQTKTKQASPPPAAPVSFIYDQFVNNGPSITSLPAVGTEFTFTLTKPIVGTTQQIKQKVQQWTTEPISITSPNSHTLANANLGGPLTVQWALPTTFTVSYINVFLGTNSVAGMCDVVSSNNLPPNTTSYTFTSMPTQCLGQPIADNVSQGGYPVQIIVEVHGTQGEVTRAWYAMGTPSCGVNMAPGGLVATNFSSTQVQLSWNRACMQTTIANYAIYRSTSASGIFNLIGSTDQNTLTFTDSSVTAGATYYYYVLATDTATNISAHSNQINVTTVASGTVSPFDGTYTGNWNVSCPACGDTAAGTFTTTLKNGVFTGTMIPITSGTHGPRFDSGSVSSSGVITGTGATPTQCSSSVSTFTGQITLPTSVDATMTMAYSRTASDTCMAESGTLTASRATGGVTTSTTTTSTTTSGVTTTTTPSTTTTTLSNGGGVSLNAGWNLLGNGLSNTITVSSMFGDSVLVSTVWKWISSTARWAFYTPTLPDGGAAFAAGKGYDFLTNINGGEGFWVNAKSVFSVQLSGNAVPTNSFADGPITNGLPQNWSLIAIGDNMAPGQFINTIAINPPAAGQVATSLTTLWAWEATGVGGWYFYAPSLVNAGTQSSYIAGKGYLDFGTANKTLGPTTGFWVNHP
jgi:hypothetical protein